MDSKLCCFPCTSIHAIKTVQTSLTHYLYVVVLMCGVNYIEIISYASEYTFTYTYTMYALKSNIRWTYSVKAVKK